jgi:hypothetical protein
MILSRYRIPSLASATCCLAFASIGLRPSSDRQFFLIVSLLLVLFCLVFYTVRLLWKWSEHKQRIAAIAILLLGPAVGVAIAPHLRSAMFAYDLPRYDAAVRWAATHAIIDQEVRLVPIDQYRDLGSVIFVRNNTQCGLIVDFFWGESFPVKHWLRRYAAAPHQQSKKECRDNWYRVRPRTKFWSELTG